MLLIFVVLKALRLLKSLYKDSDGLQQDETKIQSLFKKLDALDNLIEGERGGEHT